MPFVDPCVRVCLHAASVGIDGDDPEHITWIYEHAVERANQYGITGVNYRLTQGEGSLTYRGELQAYTG